MNEEKTCESQSTDRLTQITALLTTLGNILINKNVRARPHDPDNDSYYFYDASKEGDVEIGHIVCGLSDISEENIEQLKRWYTRSKAIAHQTGELEDIPALYVSWIDIETDYQGKGFGGLLFVYGILMSIRKYIGIHIYFLSDCSDASSKIKKNLYNKFLFIMYTALKEIYKEQNIEGFNEYFENARIRIAEEEEERRANPASFAMMPLEEEDSSDDSESVQPPSSRASSQESSQESYDETEFDELERQPVDTSVADINELIDAIAPFLEIEKSKLTKRKSQASTNSAKKRGGKRKTLKKQKGRKKRKGRISVKKRRRTKKC